MTEPLERYLHTRIPLSAALGVRVLEASPECVRLTPPLGPNINHTGTVFGGSATAVAIRLPACCTCAWPPAALQAQTLIRRNRMEYQQPIRADFTGECRFADAVSWNRILTLLKRHGRARLALETELRCLGRSVHGRIRRPRRSARRTRPSGAVSSKVNLEERRVSAHNAAVTRAAQSHPPRRSPL